jgi:hypothetical protein
MGETVLDVLVREVERCGQFSQHSEEAPLLIYWTDTDRLWESALSTLRARLPQLLTLGPLDATLRRGPALWIRWVLGGHGELPLDPKRPPIVYMPGVSRADLRAVDECPDALKLLAGLQHRGRIWTQVNGKDWTPNALLVGEKTLGLKVAKDGDTQDALRAAVPELLSTPLDALRGRELQASDFRALLISDPERALLQWLDDPSGTRARVSTQVWEALAKIAKQSWHLDLEKDGPDVAARHLCGAKGAWEKLWARFADAPARYPALVTRLHAVDPPAQTGFEDRARYPRINEKLEGELRAAFLAFEDLSESDARARIGTLEAQHAARRGWVWEHPLASALEALTRLAAATTSPLGGTSPAMMATLWVEDGWKADAAALDAMARVRREADRLSVGTAVQRLYGSWLNDGAQRFQELVAAQGFPGYAPGARSPITVSKGEVLFFADGLRYDVGLRLAARLESRGVRVTHGTRWIGMPSVTATSKPAASPVVEALDGSDDGADFNPVLRSNPKHALNSDRFRALLGSEGYAVLGDGELGDSKGRGYTEYGSLDKEGHSLHAKLAGQIDAHVEALSDRIEALLTAGWKRLRLLTDHGWVLLPQKLPNSKLPLHTHQDKWGRCAVLKPGYSVPEGVLPLPWRWRDTVTVISAPGIAVFYDGACYAHGGLSLQECLTPDFVIERGGAAAPEGVKVSWRALRCTAEVASGAEGLRFDLRRKAMEPSTSFLGAPVPLSATGRATTLVPHDNAGELAYAILADSQGNVVFTTETKIPEA